MRVNDEMIVSGMCEFREGISEGHLNWNQENELRGGRWAREGS